jgi:excisionase family DNA binding protein
MDRNSSGPLLDVKETAAAIRRPESEVRGLIAAGVLPAVKLSPRRVRVPRAALERWLEEQTERALGRSR